jgi:zinc protease
MPLMRTWKTIVALILAACCPALAAAAAPGADGLISEVLQNGMRVTILPVPDNPIVATDLWYHVGSANEDPDNRGFAHLFEHLMFGDTLNHAKDEYANHHHLHGGYENAYTSFDETVYVSRIVPGQHERVLELEADRMVNLVLDEENLANEQRIVQEELRVRYQNDPTVRVLLAAQQAVFGEHPYAYDAQGRKEDVAAATLEHCRGFYESYYRPRNAHLVVVGPVDGPRTLETSRRLFAPLPAEGKTPPDVPALLDWEYPEQVVLTENLPPVETAIVGYALPDPGHPDHWAVVVMNHILAGGQVDLFAEEMVDRRGKAVFAMTERLSFRRGGALAFAAAHLPYRRKKTAFKLTDQTLAKLAQLDWLTEERLEAAKRTLIRAQWNHVYFSGQRADSIGRSQWWFGDARVAFERPSHIDAVTLDEVRDAFQTYVAGGRPVRVYLRPERVPLKVRLFGWLYPLVN